MQSAPARRRFLRGAALAAVGAPLLAATRPLGAGADHPDIAGLGLGPGGPGGSPFTHGVASGDPGADRVTLWTRLAPTSANPSPAVRWRIATDPRLTEVVAAGDATADTAGDGCVHVDVTGLRPGTTYWYGFATDSHSNGADQHSPVGRTRTLPGPGPDADHARIAVVTCGNLENGWFNAYARVAERDDLDLVVHLGDYLYEYGDGADLAPPLPGRAHHPRVELFTRADYRTRYAQYRADPDLQHLHGRHPMVALWDDHEVVDDSWATGARGHEPGDGDFPTRQAAALAAWHEWLPRSPSAARAARTSHGPQPWQRLTLGTAIDAFVVDGRGHRPHIGDADRLGERTDTLGPDQLAWLEAGLADPAARWPVVLTQQPVTPRFDREGRPQGVVGWSGFPAAQAWMLDTTARAGALLVAGDLHSSWLLDHDGAVEAVVPSATSRSLADRKGDDHAAAEAREMKRANTSVRWLDLRDHGYLILDADPERLRVEWWLVDSVADRASGQRLAQVHEIDRSSNRRGTRSRGRRP